MKAEELKIGDYFFINNTPVKIKTLADNDISIVKYGEVAPAEIDDLTPIHLTSKILKKNDWHKQASNHEAQGWSNGHVKLYPQGEKFGGSFTFLYSGNSVQYIHHVHQLQHLLWALGIDDDLKI